MWLGRRRRLLVDDLQYRLLAVNLLYVVTVLLILAAALFLPLMLELGSEATSFAEKQEAASQFLSLHTRVWPALLAVFLLLAVHSLVVSHRVAGPLYGFRRVLRAVAEGKLTVRATIRKNDYLAKEADSINVMIAALQEKIARIQEDFGQVRAGFDGLKRAVAGDVVGAVQEPFHRLHAQMKQVQVGLDQFSTKADGARSEDQAAAKVVSAPAPKTPTSSTRS